MQEIRGEIAMTDTQTEQLTGRALDAAVAERVMGHKALAHAQTPFYSRDIADAWLVHERMIADWDTLWDYAREMNALIGSRGIRKIDVTMGLLQALTPVLICRAALAAMGGRSDE